MHSSCFASREIALRKVRSSSTLGISKIPPEGVGASCGDIDSDAPRSRSAAGDPSCTAAGTSSFAVTSIVTLSILTLARESLEVLSELRAAGSAFEYLFLWSRARSGASKLHRTGFKCGTVWLWSNSCCVCCVCLGNVSSGSANGLVALADASPNGGVNAVAPCTFPSIVPSIQTSNLPAAADLLGSIVQQCFASNTSDRVAMRYTVLKWLRSCACAMQASSAMVRQRKFSSLLTGLRETNVWLSNRLCTSATSGTSHASNGSGDMLGCLPQVMHASRFVRVSCCSHMSTSHLERWLSSGVQESDAPTSPTQPTDPLPSKISAETRSLRSSSSLTSRVCISSKAGTMTCSNSRERDTFE
eukprot:scaffold30101_cov73-Phaeocystis_antarctica.AAC.5